MRRNQHLYPPDELALVKLPKQAVSAYILGAVILGGFLALALLLLFT